MRACMTDGGEPAPSVETPLHSVLPHRFVVHTHDFATQALTDTPRPAALVREALGDEAAYVDYVRPGFPLARAVIDLGPVAEQARGLVLGRHGLIAWGDSAKACYDNLHLLINRALRFIADRRGTRARRLGRGQGRGPAAGAPARAGARDPAGAARAPVARASGDPALRRLARGAGLRRRRARRRAGGARHVDARAHPALRARAAVRRRRPAGAGAGAGDATRSAARSTGSPRATARRSSARGRKVDDARAGAAGGAAARPGPGHRDEGQGQRRGRQPLLSARHARRRRGRGAGRLSLPGRRRRHRVRVLAAGAGQAQTGASASSAARWR